MKKTLSIILAILMIVTVIPLSYVPAAAASTPTPYDGVPVTPQQISESNYKTLGLTDNNWSQFDGYYAIRNAKELYGFAAIVNSSTSRAIVNAVLLQDIVINEKGSTAYDWTPINTYGGHEYCGTFDGNGHYISGLYSTVTIYKSGGYRYGGFIATLYGTVKNLTIKDSTFAPSQSVGKNGGLGAITGFPFGCTIQNCRVENVTLTATDNNGQIGGIVGFGDGHSSDIKNCVSIVTISGGLYTSAIAPSAPYSNCYTSANESHTCADISVEHKEVKATCEYPGLSNYSYCLVCGKVTSGTKTQTPATGHNWTDATCDTPKTCLTCGGTEGSSLGHSWSCVPYNNSNHRIICQRCGKNNGTENHNWVNGKCSDCDYSCPHADGNNWITDNTKHYRNCPNGCDVKLDFENHSFVNGVCTVCDHSCKHSYNNKYKCAYCGEACPHNYEETFRFDATCSAQGIASYKCTDCGHEYDEILDSLGHKMTYTYDHILHKGVCETCGDIKEGSHDFSKSCICVCGKTSDRKYDHNYKSVYTRPTCTEDGYYTYTCTVCGDSYTEIYASAAGHWGGTATCTEKAICLRCGEPYGDEPSGHMEDYDDGNCLTPICCWICGEVTTPAREEHEWCGENYCIHCYTGKPFVFHFMDGETELFTADVEALTYHTFKVTQNKGDYAFIGWDSDGDGTADYLGPDLPYDIYVEGNMTFYAVYQKIDYVLIRYYRIGLDSGEYEISNIQRLPLNETAYLDYDYAYWYTPLGWATEPYGEKVYDYGQEITVTETLDLYTVWEPFMITFDLGEGATWLDENGNPVPEIITEDMVFTTVPTKPDYRFKYFIGYDMYGSEITYELYTNEYTGESWMWISLYGAMTLTAVWEKCTEHSYIGGECPCGETIFLLKNGALINHAKGYIYGLDAGTTSLDNYTDIIADGYEWTYSSDIFGTGTKAIFTNGETVLAEYTVLIYGDIDGNGWYDANDAFLSGFLAAGIILPEYLSEYTLMAADCNHDGYINWLDFDLLNSASILLDNIDQNSTANRLEQAPYLAYASLIDQSAGLRVQPDIDDTPSDTSAPATPDADCSSDGASDTVDFMTIFTHIFSFIQKILSWILSFIIA